jgi:hypothetical protein
VAREVTSSRAHCLGLTRFILCSSLGKSERDRVGRSAPRASSCWSRLLETAVWPSGIDQRTVLNEIEDPPGKELGPGPIPGFQTWAHTDRLAPPLWAGPAETTGSSGYHKMRSGQPWSEPSSSRRPQRTNELKPEQRRMELDRGRHSAELQV